MSENVVAFVPRPRRVPALACADVYFNNADGGLTIIVHDEVGGAHVFKYALQTLVSSSIVGAQAGMTCAVLRQELREESQT